MKAVSFGILPVGLPARLPGTEVLPRLTKLRGNAGVKALNELRAGAKSGLNGTGLAM